MKRGTIITIDGPSGVGKSTAAKWAAHKLGFTYLDTGAMYRAVALQVKRESVDIENQEELLSLLNKSNISFERKDPDKIQIILNGEDITDLIRTREIGLISSDVATKSIVRTKLVEMQREAGKNGNIVAEGRDMGTYVFPDADIEKRTSRRWKELTPKGTSADINDIKKEIEQRDKQDMERTESPLHPALNAVIIDTTNLSINEVGAVILKAVRQA